MNQFLYSIPVAHVPSRAVTRNRDSTDLYRFISACVFNETKVKSKHNFYHIAGYILLASFIYYSVDLEELVGHIYKISPVSALILILAATIDRFIMAAKWMHISSALKMTTHYFQFLKIYYVATFLGYCLPTSIGGEVYKAARLGRSEQSQDVLASMFMEKIIGVFSTVAFAWTGVLYITFNLSNENSTTLFYILTGCTVAALCITWASLSPVIHNKIIKLLSKSRISGFVKKLLNAYSGYKGQQYLIFWNFLIAIIETGLQLSIMCAIGLELNLDTPLPILASIIAVTEFIRRIAIVLDGWGLATALQLFMYSLVGIAVEHGLLIALLSHAVYFIASLPGGILILTDRWEKT